ncbi:lysine-specific demethylase phf2-like [Oncorhynchus tshawytscha]|uniref:lysine-specific demethylase phf2-like n=1 Tax=Oncorhynchus tshawytscha TaxID=74940 RepID=UPI001C3D042D|nr:lysine-specific demethylase phf2-like [Oncorhynchus tshawytscha]
MSSTARVGPSVLRQARPAREGARVASIETGLAAAAAKLTHQKEQQKTKKKQKSTKKKPPAVLREEEEEEEPVRKLSRDSSSPEPDAGRDSEPGQTDHEYSSGAGGKQAGGPQPMAPGVFLTQRRPSTFSSSHNNNNNNTAKGERGAAGGAGGAGKGDAKGEAKRLKKGMATAKQRLGKILKIHRNGKLLL